jgi:hypothetical protein
MFGTGDSQYFSVYTVRFGTERTNHNAMDTIVYNLIPAGLNISVESLSIRLGLVLSQHVFSTGSSHCFIYYEEMMLDKTNCLELKLRILEREPDFLEPGQKPGDVLRAMRLLWKSRRKTECLKQYKKMERSVDNLFKIHITESVQPMLKFGMVQLATLQDGGDLIVNYADAPNGEEYKDGFRISSVMQLKDIDEELTGPIAFVLYDKLTTLPSQDNAGLTHMFRIPNLNCLSNEQLLAVRESMRSAMARFQELLQPTLQEGPASHYLGGHWQKEKMAEVGMAIQRAIDANDELNWVLTLQSNIAIDVLVGEMDTHRFWQHMRDHGLIPDDSWEVLQALPKDGSYPTTIPIIVLRYNLGADFNERTFSEESSLQHKRKTLSLD